MRAHKAFSTNIDIRIVVLTVLTAVSVSTSGISVSVVVGWVSSGNLIGSAGRLVHTILVSVLNAVASAGLLGGVSLVVSKSASGVSVPTVVFVISVSAVVESVSLVVSGISVSTVVESVSLVVSGVVSVVVDTYSLLGNLVGSR